MISWEIPHQHRLHNEHCSIFFISDTSQRWSQNQTFPSSEQTSKASTEGLATSPLGSSGIVRSCGPSVKCTPPICTSDSCVWTFGPKLVVSFGKFLKENAGESGSLWDKPWGFTACPYLLFILHFLTTDAMWPACTLNCYHATLLWWDTAIKL